MHYGGSGLSHGIGDGLQQNANHGKRLYRVRQGSSLSGVQAMSLSFRFKFELGQEVFSVIRLTDLRMKPCEECNGAGKFLAVGRPDLDIKCSGCYGNGRRVAAKRNSWKVHQSLNISQARVELTDPEADRYSTETVKEEYMCQQTGTGSGMLHKAQALFATRLEAEDWCVAENSRIPFEDVR